MILCTVVWDTSFPNERRQSVPKPRSSKLETPTARLKLPVRRKPYTGPALARGIKLLYRRCKTNGSWVVKASNGKGGYWTDAFAQADDYEVADGKAVLSFYQAQDAAKELARGLDNVPSSKPMTVHDALHAYERDLKSRGAAIENVQRVRKHLTTALGGKPVMLLNEQDLRHWRDGLVEKGMNPATFNRTRAGLRAALELAAGDPRVANRHVFKAGLKGLPGANNARRVVLPDADVLRIVEAAYRENDCFGVLVEVLAQTGARISQVARLICIDLQADRLMMPTSYKGSRQKEQQHVPVPIPVELAAKLKRLRGERPLDAPLLIKADGRRWQDVNKSEHWNLFRAVATRAGFDPDHITSYALRHSSICRALLKGVPVSIVAKLHDTSSREIEQHYSRFILDVAGDALSRKALLQRQPPIADNVLVLPR
jgi:integrase